MSLYRQAGGAGARTLATVGVAALLVGGGIGYALGASGDDEQPSLSSAVAALRSDLAPVASGLELVTTEYPQGVHGGKIVEQTEYDAAKADIDRARAAFTKRSADVRALWPDQAAALSEALDDLNTAVARGASEDAVARLAATASRALAAIRGS